MSQRDTKLLERVGAVVARDPRGILGAADGLVREIAINRESGGVPLSKGSSQDPKRNPMRRLATK
jgi:hypothetical protein